MIFSPLKIGRWNVAIEADYVLWSELGGEIFPHHVLSLMNSQQTQIMDAVKYLQKWICFQKKICFKELFFNEKIKKKHDSKRKTQ